MADTKISALTAIPALDGADVLPIVDATDTTTKKVSVTQLDARYQALDADLTDIAAIADAQGDILVRGASGWERLAKSATSTDVLTAGASQPTWAAASSGGAPSGGIRSQSIVKDSTNEWAFVGRYSKGYANTYLLGAGSAIGGEQNHSIPLANYLQAICHHFPVDVQLTGLELFVQATGTATVAQMAVWSCDENATTIEACSWTIAAQGNVAVGTTGRKTVTLGSPVDLPAGTYMMGVVADGTFTATAHKHTSGLPTRLVATSYTNVNRLERSLTYSTSLPSLAASSISLGTGSGAGYEPAVVLPVGAVLL